MASVSYPVRFPDQLRQHLRTLRKARRLTQAQLGELLGVSQARVAEIEANPAVVSVEQLMRILALMDVSLALEENSSPLEAATESATGTNSDAPHIDPVSPQARPASEATSQLLQPGQAPASADSMKSRLLGKMLIKPRKGSW